MFSLTKSKITIFSLVALALAACEPINADAQDKGYTVVGETPEGCKVYKIRDYTPGGDAYAYATVCNCFENDVGEAQ